MAGRLTQAESARFVRAATFTKRDSVAGTPTARYHTGLKWVPRSQFSRYALPAANHKLLAICEV